MTRVGAGALRITEVSFKNRFRRDLRKLPPEIRERLMERLKALYQDPIPAGLRFEKLKGYARPDIYTFHIDGNYKASIEIHGGQRSIEDSTWACNRDCLVGRAGR
ncbi:MAG: hypothetical protein M3495_14605 [Pseudomonadota bacterium]|nr:hypothetical protein [Gammaproteobacteria bacterium]MDQ3582753.1 hypothetical protein [Pseudomonadota bacterium]